MAKIRILPEQLANQIAAGEVIERPASVVKELVENSLDAGANRIEIEIEGGGTRLIRILDNGHGMDEDDVLLSFERHGTSKITDTADLTAIRSLGFRGEAIPSIASVAKVSVISKTAEETLGTTVVLDYGKLQKIHETGCSQGTTIEVRNLFGNTPARKKFLRTTRTELGHIDEIIKNYALGSPDTAFTLRVNGKETLSFNSGHDIEQRLRSILRYYDTFIDVEASSQSSTFRKLEGLLVPPERVMAGSAKLRLFLNGRAIRDRLMNHAVFEGLRGFLLKGHSAAGYLHLHIAADEVDVNVHPAKHEVRFRNSGDIHQFIKQSVQQSLRSYQDKVRSDIFIQDQTPTSQYHHNASSLPSERTETTQRGEIPDDMPKHFAFESNRSGRYDRPLQQKSFVSEKTSLPPIPQTKEESSFTQAVPGNAEETANQLVRHGMRVIGQYKNLYIFCQSGDTLVVIDQHAAHERVLYEKFRKQYTEKNIASQTLLFPQTVELSPFQIEIVEQNKEDFKKLGFSLAEFGGNAYVITAVPALADGGDPVDIFFDVLDGYGKEGERRSPGNRIDDILATMACKAAVKSGHELSRNEIDGLLSQMAEEDLFSHCPHGRPVLKNFSSEDIKKWFYRT